MAEEIEMPMFPMCMQCKNYILIDKQSQQLFFRCIAIMKVLFVIAKCI